MSATLDFLGEDVDHAGRSRAHARRLSRAAARDPRTRRRDERFGETDRDGPAVRRRFRAREPARDRRAGRAPTAIRSFASTWKGSAVTDATLRVFERAFAEARHVGPVLQAYLKRTPGRRRADDRAAAHASGFARARTRAADDRVSGHADDPARLHARAPKRCSSADTIPASRPTTSASIEAVETFVRERDIARDRFEFQMLYGVRPELQRRLVAAGYRVRIYVPYGTHWAGYFYRRITERQGERSLRPALAPGALMDSPGSESFAVLTPCGRFEPPTCRRGARRGSCGRFRSNGPVPRSRSRSHRRR